jgi:acyl carrier protein
MAASPCNFPAEPFLEEESMDRSEVASRLGDVLVSELGLDAAKITEEAHFEEDLDVDSLGVVELLMALEDEFEVKIPDEEAESIMTVGQAIDVVYGKLGG